MMSKQLAAIETNVPLELDLGRCRCANPMLLHWLFCTANLASIRF